MERKARVIPILAIDNHGLLFTLFRLIRNLCADIKIVVRMLCEVSHHDF
ncbi:hypothetical protein BIFPSEUDO_02516 [Bifidobacterium pseudocatenulatum DSM 20438 = JCM 1200 = LMG 10505]|uniref:Uncharacterized protein n=1 Tax=Bifidobacterium pseudocatenulatum DSM 20438 = JCM 1200 = LMG 10505 TaxID=547043 RepID=C0BQ76_BIFPS|nr:hypothetical protein BIFPSEUDO_02516 [Bifidobacterium pseudocatenulatum DSM 20438 = JCM 1200 = LMG 10505]